MQRIANGTQVSALPTMAAAIGTPGYGTNGDPAAGQESSIFGADEFNPIQEELISVILAGGLTPSRSNNAQVLAALRALFGGTGNVASPGWKALGGGLILQWGFGTTTTGGGDAVVFPTVFPSACFVVSVTERTASGWYSGGGYSPTFYGANAAAPNGFGVYAARIPNGGGAAAPAVSCDFNYIALGK